MGITIILAILLILAICYGIYQKRKTYRMIDRLLDSVLSQERGIQPAPPAAPLFEGSFSGFLFSPFRSPLLLEIHFLCKLFYGFHDSRICNLSCI